MNIADTASAAVVAVHPDIKQFTAAGMTLKLIRIVRLVSETTGGFAFEFAVEKDQRKGVMTFQLDDDVIAPRSEPGKLFAYMKAGILGKVAPHQFRPVRGFGNSRLQRTHTPPKEQLH